MIYTMENTKKRQILVQVFDAHGQEQRFVTECDTETGRLCSWVTGPDGEKCRMADGHPAQETVFVPAPLRVVVRSRLCHLYKWWKPWTWQHKTFERTG